MMKSLWGHKVGMTQVFTDSKVVPVTVVNTAGWFILQIKTNEKDGYAALQVGYPRNRYQGKDFDSQWLKNKKKFFMHVKEVVVQAITEDMTIGSAVQTSTIIQSDDKVDVTGTTKGAGFAGVVRRHNYAGGPKSHGSKFGRKPGSLGFMCATGKVIKGKGLPGHMGNVTRTVQNLEIVQVREEDNLVLIKGSMAGKPGSLVHIKKRG